MKIRLDFWNRKISPDNVSSSSGGLRFGGGVVVNEDTAMKAAAYHRGVQYISTQVAKLPWDIKDSNNEKTHNNKIFELLNTAPNPEMNHFSFKLAMVVNAINSGNSYAEIERDGIGRPIALWPIFGRRVTPERSATGKLQYRIFNNSYGGSYDGDIVMDPRDLYIIRNLHTKDGIIGLGVVEYASRTLGITLGADRMASSLFNNGGMPSGVLTHPSKMSDTAFERLKKSWKESHGRENSGGIAILEEGMKFEAMNMDPQLLQMLESRKFGILEIARFLNIPPVKLYDNTAATYSNVEQANLEVTTDTLDAWARNIEAETDVKLLSGNFGGRYLDIDLFQSSRGDMKTRSDYYSKMMQTGSISPNEIRDRENMPGYAGGDDKYIAVNNYTPANRVHEVIDSQIKKNEKSNEPAKDKAKEEEITQAILDNLKR